MKYALCSDLHLEFLDIDIQNTENADVLILSGDILVAQDLHDHPEIHPNDPVDIPNLSYRREVAQRFRDFLKRVSFQFPHVVYVAGNHEFYHGKWEQTLTTLRNECSRFTNIYFLENEYKVINDVTFIGGTLWTDCNKYDPLTMFNLPNLINDFKIIRVEKYGYRKLRCNDIIDRHTKMKQFIRDTIKENPNGEFIVVGHHAPSHKSIHPRYIRDREMNGGYSSDMDEFILEHPQIKLWTLGHMHDPHSYYVGDTFVACNPRGYAGHDLSAESFVLRYIDLDNMPAKFDGVNWSRD